jgi:transcription-repair coupling factor (superfamily II helicase)
MTEAARKYFELYYKLQRCIDEDSPRAKINQIKEEMHEHFNSMTEKEKQMLDIVGIDHGKI